MYVYLQKFKFKKYSVILHICKTSFSVLNVETTQLFLLELPECSISVLVYPDIYLTLDKHISVTVISTSILAEQLNKSYRFKYYSN